MIIWPKNLIKAKILTQKFITSYKIDSKIYFPAEKVPQKNGTSCIPMYGSYPPKTSLKISIDFGPENMWQYVASLHLDVSVIQIM